MSDEHDETARQDVANDTGTGSEIADEAPPAPMLDPPAAREGEPAGIGPDLGRGDPDVDHDLDAEDEHVLTPEERRAHLVVRLREVCNMAGSAKRTQMLDHLADAVVKLADTLLDSLQ